VFDTVTRAELRPLIGDTPLQAVADRVHRIWVDFITRGEPGWVPYDTGSRTTGVLTQDVSVVDDPAGDERAVWEGVR
jgi:para-nitrobenzyl esterase